LEITEGISQAVETKTKQLTNKPSIQPPIYHASVWI